MGSWRLVDHTADLAIEARGETPEEALEALCLGLLTQVTDPGAVRASEEVPIEAEGIDVPETLVSALGELLFLVNTQGWAFSHVGAKEVSPRRIRLTAHGEPPKTGGHRPELEIKAPTYHDLFFGPDPEGHGWRARVVFDV